MFARYDVRLPAELADSDSVKQFRSKYMIRRCGNSRRKNTEWSISKLRLSRRPIIARYKVARLLRTALLLLKTSDHANKHIDNIHLTEIYEIYISLS